MGRKIYPSDISRDQFELIRGMLENAKHQTAPRKVDLYEVFCAILYLLKNGCTWRAIPGDFPGWSTVRYYFDQWTASTADGFSVLEQSLKKSGQARARREWARRKDDVLHPGCPKRQEHGHGTSQRVGRGQESLGHQVASGGRYARLATCNRGDHCGCERSRWCGIDVAGECRDVIGGRQA